MWAFASFSKPEPGPGLRHGPLVVQSQLLGDSGASQMTTAAPARHPQGERVWPIHDPRWEHGAMTKPCWTRAAAVTPRASSEGTPPRWFKAPAPKRIIIEVKRDS